jgi:hypothetical protein
MASQPADGDAGLHYCPLTDVQRLSQFGGIAVQI